MFTGIIEEIGIVSAIIRKGKTARFSVYAKRVLADIKIGDSIAINGVCLTVVENGRNHFSADAVEETLRTSSLGKLKIGDQVNLERALTLNTRLGGHIMTGHIDAIGEIRGKIMKEDGLELILGIPRDKMKYIVPKGSIGIEGASLTIARVNKGEVIVALIPHTQQTTTLGRLNIGDKINLEFDVLAKYLEGLMQGDAPEAVDKVMMNAGFMPLGIWEN